jgi:hypothetical protein
MNITSHISSDKYVLYVLHLYKFNLSLRLFFNRFHSIYVYVYVYVHVLYTDEK